MASWARCSWHWCLLFLDGLAAATREGLDSATRVRQVKLVPESNESHDTSHPLLVFQLNALQDSLAMNTQTRNMVVNEEAVNKILPEGQNWSTLHAALSDAQGEGSGLGSFHRTGINSFTKKNCQVVRYSFDPSMFLGLSECMVFSDDPLSFRPWCPPREKYLKCVRSASAPCVYGADEGGPAVAVWELDEDEALFPRESGIRVPTLLWVRDDSSEDSDLTQYEGVHGKLVKTLWGRLKSELALHLAKEVYHEILRVDLRLSWSYRAPYLLTLLTNDQSESGCGGNLSSSRFCRNMQDRYYPGKMNLKPSVVLLEEFEDPMVYMKVIPSLAQTGLQVNFERAMLERGYPCLRFRDELLVCWKSEDFQLPFFVSSDLGYEVALKVGQPKSMCIFGRDGASACNVCFNELITRLPRGQTLESAANGSLEDLSAHAAHEGALLRLKHESGAMVVIAALHLQTPSTDATGEMRSHELHQLRGQLEAFAGKDDFVILGGDFNINLAPAAPGVKRFYERFIFEGKFPRRSMVLKAINQTQFKTGFTLHEYADDVMGVAYKLRDRQLLDVMGRDDQGGCVSSKAAGRALMIDYIFADSRLTKDAQHGGICMQHPPPLEPKAIPDVNHLFPVELSDHFGVTALLHLPR